MADLKRGYYENLLGVDRFNGELWNLYLGRSAAWNNSIVDAGVAELTDDFERVKLKPSVDRVFLDVPFRTNRWGLRDKDYAKESPAGCYRIALIGASDAMGWGVEQEKGFEALLEDRLNQEWGGPENSYEVLNFSVSGHLPLRQIHALEQRVLPFRPNALIYTAHPGESKAALYDVVAALRDNVKLPDPALEAIATKAGADSQMPEPLLRRKLAPYENEVMSWGFRRLADTCKKSGIRPICVFFPESAGAKSEGEGKSDMLIAEQAGFDIIDLTNIYNDQQGKQLWLAAWDRHPNEAGHELIAHKLFEAIRRQSLIPMGGHAATSSLTPTDPRR